MAECAAEAMQGVERTAERVAVEVTAVVAIPKSYRGQKRVNALLGITYPSSDLDNIIKLILDGMNNVVWDDDNQVVQLAGEKRWAAENEEEGVRVKVTILSAVLDPERSFCPA